VLKCGYMDIDFKKIFDQQKLGLALVIVGILAVIILALPLVIPIAGVLVAFGVIAAAIYGVYKYLTK
jgi:hypothetical protein